MQHYVCSGRVTAASTVLLTALLLSAGKQVASVPAASSSSDSKPVANLVAAAQIALQQADQGSVAVTTEDDNDANSHRKASFTSPVDGYFIQARRARVSGVVNCLPTLCVLTKKFR